MALTAVILLLPALSLLTGCRASKPAVQAGYRAAIIDQLYSVQPNMAFIESTSKLLEAVGFKVDRYYGDQITVDFYRDLPTLGYKLILFRAHSGLLGSEGKTIYRTCLFTNEPYSETTHVQEQLGDQLAMARINKDFPWVFAIGDKFVSRSMKGTFDQTVILTMGCSCLYIEDLARSFIAKGASACIGWDLTVSLDYVDNVTLDLCDKLYTENIPLAQAITAVMGKNGPDPYYGAVLKFYPASSGNQTLAKLSGLPQIESKAKNP